MGRSLEESRASLGSRKVSTEVCHVLPSSNFPSFCAGWASRVFIQRSFITQVACCVAVTYSSARPSVRRPFEKISIIETNTRATMAVATTTSSNEKPDWEDRAFTRGREDDTFDSFIDIFQYRSKTVVLKIFN